MKVVRLAEATVIDGMARARGEFVYVPDGYSDPDLVSKVVAEKVEITKAAEVAELQRKDEARVDTRSLKEIIALIEKLEIAKKEAELEKDPKIREELLKQIQVELDAALARKKELEAKIGTASAGIAPVEEPPKEEPKEEPTEGEVKPVEGGK